MGLYSIESVLIPSRIFDDYFRDRQAIGPAMAGVERVLVNGAEFNADSARIVENDIAQNFFVALDTASTGPVAIGRMINIRGDNGPYNLLPSIDARAVYGKLEFSNGTSAARLRF